MVQYKNYPYFTPMAFVEWIVSDGVRSCRNPVFYQLAFGKIPETPVVTPSSVQQVVRPSAVNRYIDSVVVNPVPTVPLTVTPSSSVQTFTDGFYNPVTVEATA
jgi:hypothetical protein